jgi:hypothetical protein
MGVRQVDALAGHLLLELQAARWGGVAGGWSSWSSLWVFIPLESTRLTVVDTTFRGRVPRL